MKKTIIGALFLLLTVPVLACDICGSGAGGGYMGLLPGFRKRFVSLRYSHNGLTSHLGPGGNTTYLTTQEHFRMLELWGAVNIGNRFRLAGFIPVNFMERANGNGRFSQQGWGDVSVLAYYQLIRNEAGSGNTGLQQSLWLGSGVKLPTGKYNPGEKNIQEGAQNTFQLGTGSVDFSLNAMYDVSWNNWGMNANLGYKINTANGTGYRYGNKLSANLLAYRRIVVGDKYALSPNAGMLLEWAVKDHKAADIQVWETGGYSIMGTLGAEVQLGKVGLGMNYQTPFSQHLGEGKLKANDRGMAYVSFSF